MFKIEKLFEAIVWSKSKNALFEAIAKGDEGAVARALLRVPEGSVNRPVDVYLPYGASVTGVVGTALHVAVRYGSVRIAQMLIEAGAHVNAKDSRGDMPLHHAAERDNLALVHLLLNHGADPNGRGWCERVPMMAASGAGKSPVIIALLEAGTDLDAQDVDGHSPRSTFIGAEIQTLFAAHESRCAARSIEQVFGGDVTAQAPCEESAPSRAPKGLSL